MSPHHEHKLTHLNQDNLSNNSYTTPVQGSFQSSTIRSFNPPIDKAVIMIYYPFDFIQSF